MQTIGRKATCGLARQSFRSLGSKPPSRKDATGGRSRANEGDSDERKKHINFFKDYMLNTAKRDAEANRVKRDPSLWEMLAALHFKEQSSKQDNRMNFSIEAQMRIRDAALEALPSKELVAQARGAGKTPALPPIHRRVATWCPPDPKRG